DDCKPKNLYYWFIWFYVTRVVCERLTPLVSISPPTEARYLPALRRYTAVHRLEEGTAASAVSSQPWSPPSGIHHDPHSALRASDVDRRQPAALPESFRRGYADHPLHSLRSR